MQWQQDKLRASRKYRAPTGTGGEGNLEITKNFWSQRVTEEWNNLPNEVKSADTLDNFKNGIDNVLFEGTRGQR